MKDDIYNFVLVANILCWRWHKLVDDLTEEVDVSSSVLSDTRYEVRYRAFVLQTPCNSEERIGEVTTHSTNVLQIDHKHLLLAVCYPLLN